MSLVVDLTGQPYGVVADDPAKGVTNARGINAAIQDASGKGARLVLPGGLIHLDQPTDAGENASILFGTGVSDITLAGQGMFATMLVQEGVGDGGEWDAIVVDGASRIELCDFGVRQGIIQRPDPGQQNHLIAVYNTHPGGTTADIHGHDLYFGKALGDQLRFLADIKPQVVRDVRFSRFLMRGAGGVIQSWAPNTAYAEHAQVVHNGLQFKCKVAGTSGPVTGPTVLDSQPDLKIPVFDGTITWHEVNRRRGARSGVSFQRGFRNVEVDHFSVHGVQNSGIDMEPTGCNELSFAHIHHFYVDNAEGNTGTAVSFGGVSLGDRATHLRVADGLVLAGIMRIASTDDAVFENITVRSSERFHGGSPTESSVIVRQINNRLVLRNLRVERLGDSADGSALDIENTGDGTTVEGGTIRQGTAADPVSIDFSTNVRLAGLRVSYEGPPSTERNAIRLQARGRDVVNPQVEDVTVTSTSRLRAAVELLTRSPHATLDLDPNLPKGQARTILLSRVPGVPGNALTLTLVPNGVGPGALVSANNALTFMYESGVTRMVDLHAAVAASGLVEVAAAGVDRPLIDPADTPGPTHFSGGETRAMTHVRVTGLHCAGSAETAVILSRGLNSALDVHPMIQSVHNGNDRVWRQVDEADVPLTAFFPIMSGSQGAHTVRWLEGEVTPEGKVSGRLGDLYTLRRPLGAELFFKASGGAPGASDATGWVRLAGPPPGVLDPP